MSQLFSHPAAAVLKAHMSRPGVHPDAARCDFCGKTRRLRHNHDLKLNLCSRACREAAEASKLEFKLAGIQQSIASKMAPYEGPDKEAPEAVWLEVETLCGEREGVYQALDRLRRRK